MNSCRGNYSSSAGCGEISIPGHRVVQKRNKSRGVQLLRWNIRHDILVLETGRLLLLCWVASPLSWCGWWWRGRLDFHGNKSNWILGGIKGGCRDWSCWFGCGVGVVSWEELVEGCRRCGYERDGEARKVRKVGRTTSSSGTKEGSRSKNSYYFKRIGGIIGASKQDLLESRQWNWDQERRNKDNSMNRRRDKSRF